MNQQGPDSLVYASRSMQWLEEDLSHEQLLLLTRFREWLEIEAIPAGGIGPNEAHRLWNRHIADSLLFGVGVAVDAAECLDLGSGAGLPGIPLAIVRRDTQFALVDKSQRRCELLDRIISVLRLGNCSVIHSDFAAVDRQWSSIVSRAAMPLEELVFHVKRTLATGGTAMIGLSRRGEAGLASSLDVPGLALEVIEVPKEILDSSIQLLRIVSI